MKPKIAIVRGKFLNRFEMQFFEPLVKDFDITAFGSLFPYHDSFAFPVVKLPSPMDLPDFFYKMPVLNRLFTDAQYLLGLEQKLKGYDLVHTAETYFHYTQQCLNAKRKGYVKKVIATVLETIPFNNEGIWGRKAFKKHAREELDHIIALTNKTKEALIAEGNDHKKITVISHFVDTKRFYPAKKKDSKHITILFVGRLVEEKGVYELLHSIQIICKDKELQRYTLDFIFCGKGRKRRYIEKFSKIHMSSQHVRLQDASYGDMPEVYRQADIFVAPSKSRISRGVKTWEEQYNTALLEAQASGLAIVTTNSGGIPQNVGDAAILVPPGDVRAISSSIKEFILHKRLREDYGKRARKRAINVHDISIGTSKLKELYLKVLAQ